MTAIFVIILFLAFKDAEFGLSEGNEYISKESTNRVRGLFTILIFLSHYVQYLTVGQNDLFYVNVKNYLGQAVVIPYLFYSGYGMLRSASKNKKYVASVIRYRIPRVFLQMTIAVTLYLILMFCLGKGSELTISRVFLSYLGWESLGNSNWYIFGILGEYIFFCIAFWIYRIRGSKPALVIGMAIITAFTVLFVIWIRQQGKPQYFYDTLIIFPVGCWYALLSEEIEKEKLLKKSYITVGLCAFIVLLLFRNAHICAAHSFMWKSVWHVTFAAALVLFTMVVRFESPILKFFGNHVFSIYMLQRIPMIIMSQYGWINETPQMAFVIALVCTCLIAPLFDKVTNALFNKMRLIPNQGQ